MCREIEHNAHYLEIHPFPHCGVTVLRWMFIYRSNEKSQRTAKVHPGLETAEPQRGKLSSRVYAVWRVLGGKLLRMLTGLLATRPPTWTIAALNLCSFCEEAAN